MTRVILYGLAVLLGLSAAWFLMLALGLWGRQLPPVSTMSHLVNMVIAVAGMAGCGLGLAILDMCDDIGAIRQTVEKAERRLP